MPRISVVTPEKAEIASPPEGVSTSGDLLGYLKTGQFPLQLYRQSAKEGAELQLGPMAADSVAFVWRGEAAAGGHTLPAGSSIVVERGEAVSIQVRKDGTEILVFFATEAVPSDKPGGHVHILPAGKVPTSDDLGGGTGVAGAIHADSGCPTCDVWLHENRFPGALPMSEEEKARGVHSHTEDEIIFVTGGQMRLGNKLVGPGTALAIAADTLYSFTPGPDGLSFVNFRASMPGDINFANGMAISETGYWRERLPRPEYLEPVA